MPHWDRNYGFDQFRKLLPVLKAAEEQNEANTRLLAIDTMLFEVLGWDKLEVDAEKYCREEGYADYAVKDGPGFSLILEAKKAGSTFVLPDYSCPETPVGFALLANQCPSAEKAMRQALGYAAHLGARYIAISNGHQWLVTLTFVSGQSLTERSVLVFESLSAIEKKFGLLWDCFSPQGIAANRPADRLLEGRKAPPPPKLSQSIPNYPVPATRNQIVNELSAVLATVWGEINHEEDDEEFLKACYVEPEASASGVSLAKALFEQRLSTDQRAYSAVVTQEKAPDLIKSASPEKPVVVLGQVGHGKTTFLRYLRLIKAKDILQNYIQITVNFLDRPDTAAEVPAFVYGQIEEQLRERYEVDVEDNAFVRAAINRDLNIFKKTPEAEAFPADSPDYKREELKFIQRIKVDRHLFFKRVFAHLRGSRRAYAR